MTDPARIPDEIAPHDVVRIALYGELLLLFIALLWAWLRELPLALDFEPGHFLAGAFIAAPLLFLNLAVLHALTERQEAGLLREFRDTVVLPLCGKLSVAQAFLISLFSGVAEEIFFRGSLQVELEGWLGPLPALVGSSFLFAYVHFLGAAKKYFPLLLGYWACGMYFVWTTWFYDSLFPAVFAHGLFNFFTILHLRRQKVSPAPQQSDSAPQDTEANTRE